MDYSELLFASHISELARIRRAAYLRQIPDQLRDAETAKHTVEDSIREVVLEARRAVVTIRSTPLLPEHKNQA